MSGSPSKLLNWYARLVVATTFLLVFFGAMVTTRDAGLSVPDWPLSFGSINPPQYLQDIQVFWEHSHRLIGATVGLLVIGLAVWLTKGDNRRWVKWLGWAVLLGVIFQGVLGGLRVSEKSLTLAIIHGCVGQAVLCALFLIAVVTSSTWFQTPRLVLSSKTTSLRLMSVLFTTAVYIQLIIGALMRHHKAGLAIPVFPQSTLDGKWLPSFWTFPISIHFAHRAWAIVLVLLAAGLAFVIWSHFARSAPLRKCAVVLMILLGLQVILGANIIWHLRPFTLTTLHVVNGAAILASAFYIVAYAFTLVPPGTLLAQNDPGIESETKEVYS